MSIHANPTQSNPVTLNLFEQAQLRFQGPLDAKVRAHVMGANPSGWLARANGGCGGEWMLKQVQDDGQGLGQAAFAGVEFLP